MKCLVLDSTAIFYSATALYQHNQLHPWVVQQKVLESQGTSFVTTTVSIINAYSMAATKQTLPKLMDAIDLVLAPFNNAQYRNFSIVAISDSFHARELGEFSAPFMQEPLEDVLVGYVCREMYAGAEICGYDADVYRKLGLSRHYKFS